MLIIICQTEFISHKISFVCCICPRTFDLCSSKLGLAVVMQGSLTVWVGAGRDVDTVVAGAGEVIAEEGAFELAGTEVGDGGGGGVVDEEGGCRDG